MLAALLTFYVGIEGDYYGNARSFRGLLAQPCSDIFATHQTDLFSLTFRPGQGRHAAFAAIAGFGSLFGWSVGTAIYVANSLAAGLLTMLWARTILRWHTSIAWRFLLIGSAICSPVLLALAGHLEMYAPVLPLMLAAFVLLVESMEQKSVSKLWLLLVVLVLSLRFHAFFVLLFPGWALAFVNQYLSATGLSKLLRLKTCMAVLGGAALAAGLVLYFLVLGDHNDPRSLEGDVPEIDRLFLPLFSPEPPLDRYNLLSINHLFDLLQVFLLLAPIPLVLLAGTVLPRLRRFLWNKPATVALLFCVALLVLFVCAINPLMSLPMDWDLYAMPAIGLGVLVAWQLRQLEVPKLTLGMAAPLAAMWLFCLLPFAVMHQKKAHSWRLQSVAMHVYNTYYIHSGTYLLFAIQLPDYDNATYLNRSAQLIEKLEANSVGSHNPKLAEVLFDHAFMLSSTDEEKAFATFERGLSFDAQNHQMRAQLANRYLAIGKPEAAYQHAAMLLEIPYPDLRTALLTSIHAAVEANKPSELSALIQQYQLRLGQHPDVQAAAQWLESKRATQPAN